MKDHLIRLGHEKPELREHLKPILDTLTQKGATYFSITDSGLKPLNKFQVQPNARYYFGASSDPNEVVVTDVSADTVTYIIFDYEGNPRTRKEVRGIFEDLAFRGTTTWVSNYGNHWPEDAQYFKDLLAGKPVRPLDVRQYVRDQEYIPVFLERTSPNVDLWGQAKSYGVVQSMTLDESLIKVKMRRGLLEAVENNNALRILDVSEAEGDALMNA
jgi:hypothetical protein